MKLRHDLVLITWDDAGELGLGWMPDGDIQPKEMLVETIGFLVAKTKTHMVVASTSAEHDGRTHNHGQFQIPRRMIKRIEYAGRRGGEFPVVESSGASTNP